MPTCILEPADGELIARDPLDVLPVLTMTNVTVEEPVRKPSGVNFMN